MSRFLVDPQHISETQVELQEKETHHIKNVLRFKEGDVVVVFDGVGNEYRCQIESLEKKEALLSILEKIQSKQENSVQVSLAHSVTKGERFDWVVEKGTELGMQQIIPFNCERVNVKLNEENKIKKQQRWERITQAASKQSGRVTVPKVSPVLKFDQVIELFSKYDAVLLAYELENGTDLKNAWHSLLKDKKIQTVLAIVGPEGGFSTQEVDAMVQAGAQSVSLGQNILRTETAAIAMVAMIQYELLS